MARSEDEPVAVAIARWCEVADPRAAAGDDDNTTAQSQSTTRKANAKFEAVRARVLAARARQ